jgi:23S rRNA (cytosine1962-C5)-methyltransferase
LLRRHPWVFDGAIERAEGDPRSGATVEIVAADGRRLGVAAWSPESQIAARVWSFEPDSKIDDAFFRARIERAVEFRRALPGRADARGAERLVNAESDGLPGVIVDRYADVVVCQFLSAGAERWRETIVEQLVAVCAPASVYERSDADVRAKEGLESRAGVVYGSEPPAHVEIAEGPCRFLVDVRNGHKTGFYLDQRENRFAIGELAPERSVLNAFAYTGAFAVHALKAGADSVTNVDTSAEALELAVQQAALNEVTGDRLESVHADVFHELRRFRDSRRSFDVVVLDPPKFADAKAHVDRAARGYKDINLLAFKLLRPGGVLMTFSCSGAVSTELFQKIVADAAVDAGRDARIVRHLGQAPDHPVALGFPEGAYLKGLVCAV